MAEKSEHFDVIIIGGGPAGLSAALWCAHLGLKAVLIEKEAELGGQLLWTFNAIKNYLGIEAANGQELRDRFLQHVEKVNVTHLTNASVMVADLAAKSVGLDDGRQFSARAMILATGVRRRTLNIPGEDEFFGRGVLESGVKSKTDVRAKTVVIVGGGDAALENALHLSETAKRVVVVHRRDELSARPEFVERARQNPSIEFVFSSQLTQITGGEIVKTVDIRDLATAKTTPIATDALLIRIGVIPNTELFQGQVSTNDGGYVVVNADCETGLPGIYAAGDVANQRSPTISSAVGTAAAAAKNIFSWLAHD